MFPNDAFVAAAYPRSTGGREREAIWIVDHEDCLLRFACVDEHMRRRMQQFMARRLRAARQRAKLTCGCRGDSADAVDKSRGGRDRRCDQRMPARERCATSSKNVLRKELHRESCIVCSVRVRVAHVGLPESKRDYGHAHVPHASRIACLRAHARPWCASCACWW